MKIIFLNIIFFVSVPLLLAQKTQDSSSYSNNLKPDSTLQLKTVNNKTYDVDTTVFATSKDSIFLFVNKKQMEIYGEGILKYKQMKLESAAIYVDFQTSNVDAVGIPSDSIKGVFVNTPVLTEGQDVYQSFRMRYNFKTSQGIMAKVSTKDEEAIYAGEKIKKMDKETYFIKDGIYTTCDHNPPHYYFYSPQMKVIQNDQIIAKWVWLKFGGVPFPIPLPFAVFPIQSGRRSGIIPPIIGSSSNLGQSFTRFGYFWAISDYLDLNLTADYFTRGSFRLNSRFRYVKRYNYSGNVEGSYSVIKNGENTDPNFSRNVEWRFRWSHNQQINPTTNLAANLEFLSNNFFQSTSTNINDVLLNEIRSNATLFKRWEESGNSLSLSYSRRQVLQTGDVNETLPIITFSKAQDYPFRKSNSLNNPAWYELFGYNYSGQFQNVRNKTNGVIERRGGFLHTINASASPKIGHISITPNLAYQEKWYNKRISKRFAGLDISGKDSIVTEDKNEINFVRTFRLGLAASTKFYGIMQPNILGISAIRHTVLPTISYSFQPDFSKPFWGYYDSYKDSKGNEIRYDKFQREIYGGVGAGEQQSISLNIANIFEMKTQTDPTDTTSKEKKIQLLNLNAGISYNFAADSLKFSDLILNYRTQIGNLLNLSGSSSFTLYDYTKTASRINKFLISEGKGLLRLTSLSFSISTSLSGERLKSDDDSKALQNNSTDDEFILNGTQGSFYKGIYNTADADFTIPWDISLNYNYSLSRPTPLQSVSFSNISGSLNFNLTRNWKLAFTGSYDFNRKEFAAPQVRISRDLHAWILNFTWNPGGTLRGYFLEIRVKAPQLSDLKITKRDQFFNNK